MLSPPAPITAEARTGQERGSNEQITRGWQHKAGRGGTGRTSSVGQAGVDDAGRGRRGEAGG